ncbi:ABC transporter ATP-binding protein [Paenibacillus turpanensis]|uniref:ABC transporter ATP-binding protein n=1 Tax=Paenibacillus turpanensis TaxID=2689078 RepID=UPI00140B9F36|nr:ABC transporter ATP-binding protein [Paenibacillus turpanensis]
MELAVRDLCFGYGDKETIRGISLTLGEGQCVSIVGPNGAGKTTLLKCLGAIVPTKRGVIALDGKPLMEYAAKERARRIAYVPQQGAGSFPMTVMDTVMLGRKPYVSWSIGERDLLIVERILQDLNLTAMSSRFVDELSGGERQKVWIARALAQQPDILLLDEPIAALDIRHQLEVLEKTRELASRDGTLIVMILHDLELAARFSDRLILMNRGEVVMKGQPSEVLTHDRIREVYGVEVVLENGPLGLKVTPVRPLPKLTEGKVEGIMR